MAQEGMDKLFWNKRGALANWNFETIRAHGAERKDRARREIDVRSWSFAAQYTLRAGMVFFGR